MTIHQLLVMAGLVPAIHVLQATKNKDVDARDERGHDALRVTFRFDWLNFRPGFQDDSIAITRAYCWRTAPPAINAFTASSSYP